MKKYVILFFIIISSLLMTNCQEEESNIPKKEEIDYTLPKLERYETVSFRLNDLKVKISDESFIKMIEYVPWANRVKNYSHISDLINDRFIYETNVVDYFDEELFENNYILEIYRKGVPTSKGYYYGFDIRNGNWLNYDIKFVIEEPYAEEEIDYFVDYVIIPKNEWTPYFVDNVSWTLFLEVINKFEEE